MRRIVSKNSARVVELTNLVDPPVAIYPDQVCASRMVGVSRQALSKAIKTGTRVKNHLWMKLFDYEQKQKESTDDQKKL